jgi:hypothetical protein
LDFVFSWQLSAVSFQQKQLSLLTKSSKFKDQGFLVAQAFHPVPAQAKACGYHFLAPDP